MPLFQFNALSASMGGTVTCQSDTNCVLSSQSSNVSMLSPQSSSVSMLSPQSSNIPKAPMLRAEFVSLGSAKSAALNLGGRLIGGCVKQSKSTVEGAVDNKPILFSVNFFPTADCSGSRKISSFRFLLMQGRGGGTLTCRSEKDIYAPAGMLRILP